MNGDVEDRPFRPVLEALELLVEPGGVAELRAIGIDGRVSSGYFGDLSRMAAAAEVLDASGEFSGVYLTLNPVDPALLSRRANRVQSRLGRKDATTADGDILRRRWLPIDVDPVRPSGISATADEHRAACRTARAICEALTELGWPRPIVADSGNGGHLLYRVDLPNDAASTALVKAVLGALDARFSNEEAKVDTANHNAARIWKCYGTVGRKGDSTKDRPHRRSAFVSRPSEPEVVPASLLRALAGSLPAPEPPAPAPAASPRGGIDLRAWLAEHGIGVAAEKPWQGATLFTLRECPFSDAHTDGAYAIQFGNGAVHAGCKHDSCGGGRQRWPELRARFEAGRAPTREALPPVADEMSRPDDAAIETAREVLEHGDPVRYFLDAFARDHVGDATLARCLVASIASQTVLNSRGLHVYVTGESGKGKSSGMMAMLRQVPEEFRLAERMSNKALYYSDDIGPGTVLLLDDIALSEELQEVFKESTTKFTERIRMRVVNRDRKVQHCTIPERCVWWLANVSALYDDQVLNRMLIAWVDDSEEQDREVFWKKLALGNRAADEAVPDPFELRVCREMWRLLKEQGLVYVRIPFALRIRMASVRNRRNPDVLLDLIRSFALIRLFQRERRSLDDGGLEVFATEEDFSAAAALFVDLHGTGGSLSAKFDRSEDVVLGLAARFSAEQFTIADVQRWTGWTYHKARRTLLGRTARGVEYPGLLDKSPALTLVDRTVSEEDEEGQPGSSRQHVFLFDPAIYREVRASGLVWLEDEPPSSHDPGRGNPVATPVATRDDGRTVSCSENSGECEENNPACCHDPDHTQTACAAEESSPEDSVSGSVATSSDDLSYSKVEGGSDGGTRGFNVATGVATPCATAVPQRDCANSIDPHAFVPTDGPEWERCAVCGRKPSHYRERSSAGSADRRRLCKRCYGRAVGRERAKVAPLAGTVDPSTMTRVGASVGRCSHCGLAPAAWAGGGTRLCEECYEREVRRVVERGSDMVNPAACAEPAR